MCAARRDHCSTALAKSGLFSFTRRATSRDRLRDRLVRLSGWTQRKSSEQQRTLPPSSARSARSSRWSTRCSRSERGCCSPTRPSGRNVVALSRWLRARRFPIERRQPTDRQTRHGDVAGARRWCSRGSCSPPARPPAASSVESRRWSPAGRSRLRTTCERRRGRQTRGDRHETQSLSKPRSTRRVLAQPRRAAQSAQNVLGVTTAVSTRGVRLGWQRPADSDHVAVLRARGARQIQRDRLPRPRDELPRRVCALVHHVPVHDRQLRRAWASLDRCADVRRDQGCT